MTVAKVTENVSYTLKTTAVWIELFDDEGNTQKIITFAIVCRKFSFWDRVLGRKPKAYLRTWTNENYNR